MSASARRRALEELRSRIGRITSENGFNTDIGQLVFMGERAVLGPDDPDHAIVIDVGDDEPGYQGEKVQIRLPVQVNVIAKADATDPWGTIEDAIADVKTAVETDHDLAGTLIPRGLERGSTKPIKREDASEFVGVTVEYSLRYQEGWGRP